MSGPLMSKSPTSQFPEHRLPVRVYYEDTDAGGIVYHASYIRFAERGRTEFVRMLGLDQGAFREGTGLGFAVRSMTVDYLKPALLDDELDVLTEVQEARGASITFLQTILRGDEPLTTLSVKVVCLNKAGRPQRLPNLLRHTTSQNTP